MIGLPVGKKGVGLTGMPFGDGWEVTRRLPTLHKSRFIVRHRCGAEREMFSSVIGRVKAGKEKARCRACQP